MKIARLDYIINTVSRTNILPVESSCNTSCIFCSHRQNPAGIEVYRLPELTVEDYKEIIQYLSPERKIVIGEAATRIIEGEPLLYGKFPELLKIIRSRFPKTPVQITTNGILLNSELIDFMHKLGNIEIKISVNCVDPVKRGKILGPKRPDDILAKLKTLSGKIRFSASCVYMPGIINEKDIEDFVKYMDLYGADCAEIYLEGYTDKNRKQKGLKEMQDDLNAVLEPLREKYAVPVIIGPCFIDNLDCRVDGVVKGSPAHEAGITRGNIIKVVNDQIMLTRVHAFNTIYDLRNPRIKILKNGKETEIILKKEAKASAGLVMMYDIDTSVADDINAIIGQYNAKDVLIMTSELAEYPISILLEKKHPLCKYEIISVKNRFFGGNIKCAGLLTIEDIGIEFERYLKTNAKPDIVLLPKVMFDFTNRDLTGRKVSELEEKFGVNFEIC